MSRLPGPGVAQTLIALIFLAAVVGVGAFSIGLVGNSPAGPSPSPTLAAAEPTATDSPAPPTTIATPTPASEPSPTVVPGDGAVAYQNPDGISPEGFAGDDYPFIAQAETLPTYGTLWADPNQRDWHIGLTHDIAGAIELLKDGIPRGITVYFYIVEMTQAEVCAIRDAMFEDRDELMTHGIFLMGGGCGNREMRVRIMMSPDSPEAVAYMRERYPGPVDYESSAYWPLRPYERVTFDDLSLTAIRSDSLPSLMTCGARPFPASALMAPTGAEDASGPEYEALRESLAVYDEIYPDLESLTWQLAEKDAYGATFLARRGDGWLHSPAFVSTSGWVPGVVDDCSPSPVDLAGVGNAQWRLDPEFPAPNAASTKLHVLMHETGCAGGSSPEGRLLPPVAEYGASTLRITVNIRPGGGFSTCPGNPAIAVTIVLPEPLGDRDLQGGAAPW